MPFDYGPMDQMHDEMQKSRARQNVASSVGTNPDTYARSFKEARDLGLPLPSDKDSLDALHQRTMLNRAENYLQSPGMRDLLANEEIARLTAESPQDWDSLSLLDQLAVGIKEGVFRNDIRKAVNAAFQNTAEGRQAHVESLAGFDDVDEGTRAELMKWAAAQESPIFSIGGSLFGPTEEERRYAPERLSWLQKEMAGLPVNSTVARISESDSMLDNVLDAALNPFDAIVLPLVSSVASDPVLWAMAPVGGAALGFGAPMAMLGWSSYRQEYGATFMSLLQEAGVNVENPDALREAFEDANLMARIHGQARDRATVVAAFDAASTGLGKVSLRPISGVNMLRKRLMSAPAKAEAAKEIVEKAGKGTAKAASRGTAGRVFEDMASQLVAQSAMGGAGEAFGNVAIGKDVDWNSVFLESIGELATAPIEILSARAEVKRTTEKVERAARAQTVAQRAQAGVEAVASSPLAQRAPEVAARAAQTMVSGTPFEAVTFNGLEIGESADALKAALPDRAAQIDEAMATGGDMAISFGELVLLAKTAPDVYAQVSPKGRFGVAEMSFEEAEAFLGKAADEVRDAFTNLEAEVRTHDENRVAQTERIRAAFEPVREALKNYGLDDDMAEASLSLMGTMAENVASVTGVTPEEFIRSHAPGVEVRDDQTGAPVGFHLEADELGGFQARGRKRSGIPDKDLKAREKNARGTTRRVEGYKGVVGNYDPNLNLISLFKGTNTPANVQVFLHETGHYWLNTYLEVALSILTRPTFGSAQQYSEAEARLINTLCGFLKWGGEMAEGEAQYDALIRFFMKSEDEQRAFHEKFANAFTEYVASGRAPNKELQSIFARFATWLKNVYVEIMRHGGVVSDEVAKLFDQLFISEQQIEEARSEWGKSGAYDALLKAGMSEEEFRVFADLRQRAVDESEAYLRETRDRDSKALIRARDKEEGEFRRDYRAMLQARADEYDAMPGVRASKIFSSGLEVNGTTLKLKIRADSVADIVPKDLKGKMGSRKVTTKEDSVAGFTLVDADYAVALLGFGSQEEMFRAIDAARENANDRQAWIEELAKADFEAKYGETIDKIKVMAQDAMHTETRERVVATELAGLKKQLGSQAKILAAYRAFARDFVGRQRLATQTTKQRLSGRWTFLSGTGALATAKRLSNKAIDLLKADDINGAAAAKQGQLIQELVAKERDLARKRAGAFVKRVRMALRSSTIHGSYLEQIELFASRLGFKGHVGTDIASWNDFLESNPGLVGAWEALPDSIRAVMEKGSTLEWPSLTVNEFNALDGFLSIMIKSGRGVEQEERNNPRRLVAADLQAMDASVREVAGKRGRGKREYGASSTNKLTRAGIALKQIFWHHIRGTAVCEILDGNKQGVVTQTLVYKADDCGNYEVEQSHTCGEMLADALAIFTGRIHKQVNEAVQYWPFDGVPRWENLIMVALNCGNESNRSRLLNSGFSEEQLAKILGLFTAKELKGIQAVWDIFEYTRKLAAAMERRINGREPDWMQAQAFKVVSADGVEVELKGGYIPLRYDRRNQPNPDATKAAVTIEDAADERQRKGFTGMSTSRTYTKRRSSEVVPGLRLDLSLSVVTNGLAEVVHDISWREWCVYAKRILEGTTVYEEEEVTDPKTGEKKKKRVPYKYNGLLSVVDELYGPDMKQVLVDWVHNIASEARRTEDTIPNMAFNRVRQATSIASLGFNFTSAIVQVTGLIPAMTRIGAGYMASGLNDFMRAPQKTWEEIALRSPLMRYRNFTRTREIADVRATITEEGVYGKHTSKLYDAAYFMMLTVQGMVDRMVWSGAFRRAMDEGMDEATAIKYADRMVIDTQGNGSIKDASALENGAPYIKMFLSFYSFMGTALSLNVSSWIGEENRTKAMAQIFTICMVLPAVEAVLRAAIQPGEDDDDDEPEDATEYTIKGMRFLLGNSLNFLLGQFILSREIASAAGNLAQGEPVWTWRGPSGARVISDTVRLFAETQQGEFDTSFWKSVVNVLGDMGFVPGASQINRTITGYQALEEEETENPLVLLMGYQTKK